MKPKFLTLPAVLAAMVLLQGCTHVAPYQRGALAKPEMSWSPDHQDATLQKHIYFAKEASSGGAEAAGGGCGCN
ncbi:MAG TPA: DUF4266 domain-containing protein [Cellvibrionaceae bacterium]|nr:DUF4266 domain-containing protein [Cellvibrionaceae bacterium]HNG62029.1 DUF4266 domain-containing protein [Cellvibrionaceae bacterium]